MPLLLPAAASPWGPALCAAGAVALAGAVVGHGLLRWPTILAWRGDTHPPTWPERLSLHLLIYGVWALGFGAAIWRGVPPGMIDVRFAFERRWPVIEAAEWIYVSVYLVPCVVPWIVSDRVALRRYALHLWWLLAISLLLFWLVPAGSPPRAFEPTSLAGRLLAWETHRADFAAASLPSFHVFWALLCAAVLATRGRVARVAGWTWAAAVAVSCVANGAHALADVAASGVIYAAVVAGSRAAAGRRAEMRPMMNPASAPAASAPSPK